MIASRRRAFVLLAGCTLSAAAAVAMVPRRSALQGPAIVLDAMVPQSFGNWKIDPRIVPIMPNAELQKIIEETYDQTLARTYINPEGYQVMLSIAYGGRRNQGMDIHRPEICYPAQGLALRSDTVDAELLLDARQRLPIKRLVAGSGNRHEPISYWLVIGRNLASFGYGHRIALLKYGLTGRVPDGMLVRVSSVDKNEGRSFEMQDVFLRDLLAAVAPADRQRLLGTAA